MAGRGKIVALSCLAPDIIEAIVEGRQATSLTASKLLATPLALECRAQEKHFLGVA